MRGIPQSLLSPIRRALKECDEFHSQRQMYAIFEDKNLKPWQDGILEAGSLGERVDFTISYLAGKRRSSGENALVLLLKILGDRYDPGDERHGRLLALADQLEWLKDRPTKPEVTVLEANPDAAKMLWVADAERMLACARSVARIDVPRFVDGKQYAKSTGTAWLITPNLAITCWHVIEARSALEPPIDPADLQMQVDNSLLTFDYTVAGKGLQYRIAALEYPTLGSHRLDCSLLRLADRTDHPLDDRGYLRPDIEPPLTTQTQLYIIQHPLGQPQQGAGDSFVSHSTCIGRILYKTPTEPGTSGSPVFNRANWLVVALHNGENEAAHLREGTLIRDILADLKVQSPELDHEIISAQSVKE